MARTTAETRFGWPRFWRVNGDSLPYCTIQWQGRLISGHARVVWGRMWHGMFSGEHHKPGLCDPVAFVRDVFYPPKRTRSPNPVPVD